MTRRILGLVLSVFLTTTYAGVGPNCIKWPNSMFIPVPNQANGQIAPAYGLYWLHYDPKTNSELYKRAYTPHSYLPFFSDGTPNLPQISPNPSDDNGRARDYYNSTVLKGFYDPQKPTIIFLHGWQPNTVEHHRRFDFCYSYPTSQTTFSPIYNTLKYWQGWNVAVFYWSQFADEDSYSDTEAKLYSSGIYKKMRWAYQRPNDSQIYYCDSSQSNCFMPMQQNGSVKTIADLALEAIENALSSTNGKEFRIVGQSFGAQLAILTTHQLLESRSPLRPTRLVLLDPYFTIGTLEGLFGGDRVAQHDDQLVTDILKQNIPISEYRTSNLSVLYGDDNPWLISHTAFMRLFPKYIAGDEGLELLADLHVSSIYLYFQSASASSYWNDQTSKNWDHSYINAKSSNDEVKTMMGMSRFQVPSLDHLSERNFPDTKADKFDKP